MSQKVNDCPGCSGCPMQKLYPENIFVSPLIRPGSTRIMIAQEPGLEDIQENEPLCGGSGRFLRGLRVKDFQGISKRYGGLIGEAGLKDIDISYIHVVQCRPPSKCKKCGNI